MLRVSALVLTAVLIAQSQNMASSDVRSKIDKVIDENIAQGTFVTSEGVRVQTKVPLSPQRVNEIKDLGEPAIQILSEYAFRSNPKKQRISIDLLGRIGGPDTVSPLREVLFHSKSPLNRLLALDWLSQAPKDIRDPIIERVKDDADPQIRGRARDLLKKDSDSKE